MVKAKVSRGGHVSYRTPLAAVPAAIHSQPLRYVGKVCGRVRVRVRVAGAGQHAFALLSMLSPPLLPSSPSSTSSSSYIFHTSISFHMAPVAHAWFGEQEKSRKQLT